jgi:small GTP-binding protein domain
LIIALAGQQNSGKSTIFNQLAGCRAITSNFPGKTVQYTKSQVNYHGRVFDIVDLPGTYSLTSFDLAELESRKYLLKGEVDVVINVIDASLLSRSLELTKQLMELEIPLVLCLNPVPAPNLLKYLINVGNIDAIYHNFSLNR